MLFGVRRTCRRLYGRNIGNKRPEGTRVERQLADFKHFVQHLRPGYFVPGVISNFPAIFTKSASDSASIFRMALPRWIFTVISLVPSS